MAPKDKLCRENGGNYKHSHALLEAPPPNWESFFPPCFSSCFPLSSPLLLRQSLSAPPQTDWKPWEKTGGVFPIITSAVRERGGGGVQCFSEHELYLLISFPLSLLLPHFFFLLLWWLNLSCSPHNLTLRHTQPHQPYLHMWRCSRHRWCHRPAFADALRTE